MQPSPHLASTNPEPLKSAIENLVNLATEAKKNSKEFNKQDVCNYLEKIIAEEKLHQEQDLQSGVDFLISLYLQSSLTNHQKHALEFLLIKLFRVLYKNPNKSPSESILMPFSRPFLLKPYQGNNSKFSQSLVFIAARQGLFEFLMILLTSEHIKKIIASIVNKELDSAKNSLVTHTLLAFKDNQLNEKQTMALFNQYKKLGLQELQEKDWDIVSRKNCESLRKFLQDAFPGKPKATSRKLFGFNNVQQTTSQNAELESKNTTTLSLEAKENPLYATIIELEEKEGEFLEKDKEVLEQAYQNSLENGVFNLVAVIDHIVKSCSPENLLNPRQKNILNWLLHKFFSIYPHPDVFILLQGKPQQKPFFHVILHQGLYEFAMLVLQHPEHRLDPAKFDLLMSDSNKNSSITAALIGVKTKTLTNEQVLGIIKQLKVKEAPVNDLHFVVELKNAVILAELLKHYNIKKENNLDVNFKERILYPLLEQAVRQVQNEEDWNVVDSILLREDVLNQKVMDDDRGIQEYCVLLVEMAKAGRLNVVLGLVARNAIYNTNSNEHSVLHILHQTKPHGYRTIFNYLKVLKLLKSSDLNDLKQAKICFDRLDSADKENFIKFVNQHYKKYLTSVNEYYLFGIVQPQSQPAEQKQLTTPIVPSAPMAPSVESKTMAVVPPQGELQAMPTTMAVQRAEGEPPAELKAGEVLVPSAGPTNNAAAAVSSPPGYATYPCTFLAPGAPTSTTTSPEAIKKLFGEIGALTDGNWGEHEKLRELLLAVKARYDVSVTSMNPSSSPAPQGP